MPKPYGTNHQVHIRSIVEHVLVLQRLSESPFHASRHSNSRNFSLQRAPGAAEGGGDGVYRDIGDAMAGASIQADSHAFEVLAHAHVHAASAAGGPAAVARGPEEREAAALAGGRAEEDAHVSRYSNGPATPRRHALRTHLLAVSHAASHDYSPRARFGATASAASRWIRLPALSSP